MRNGEIRNGEIRNGEIRNGEITIPWGPWNLTGNILAFGSW